MLAEEPSLAALIEAVRAEDRSADLAGAVRRSGDQNFVLEANGWIYRFPRDWIDFDREMAVLNTLHGRLPVATPRVEWVGRHHRFCAYRKITGWPFNPSLYRSAPRRHQQSLAASMAEYLIALHDAMTEAELESIGIPDFFTLAARADLININDIPQPIATAVESMLQRARELSDQLDGRMLLDNDFTTDNIVLDSEMGTLTGVWDYSGVTVGPASFDFRALLRDPDPLTDDVVQEYEQRTGRDICREAFTLAFRITDLRRHLRKSPTAAINLVQNWRR